MSRRVWLGVGVGIISWLMAAFFSLAQMSKILRYTCTFMSNWPLCASASLGWSLWLRNLVLFILFSLLILYGYLFLKMTAGDFLFKKMQVYILAAVFVVLAFCTLPFTSGDVQYYYSLGKSVDAGINPYTQEWKLFNSFIDSPIAVSETKGVMYGPLFVSLTSLIFEASQGNLVWFIMLWKLLMVGVLVGCGMLAFRLLRLSSAFASEKFYFFWFTQPLLLWEWVVNGHFDGLWLACVLAAFLCARSKKWWAVIALLIVGTWIKFLPLLIAPWFVLWWWQETSWDNWKQQLKQAALGLGLGAIVTYIFWYQFWEGFTVFEPLLLQTKWVAASLFGAVYYSLKPLAVYLLNDQAHWYLTRAVHGGLLIMLIYFFLPYVRQIKDIVTKKTKWGAPNYLLAASVSLLLYLIVWQKSIWPWYLIWPFMLGFIPYVNYGNIYLRKILIWIGLSPLALTFLQQLHIRTDAPPVYFSLIAVFLIFLYPLIYLLKWRKIDYKNNI